MAVLFDDWWRTLLKLFAVMLFSDIWTDFSIQTSSFSLQLSLLENTESVISVTWTCGPILIALQYTFRLKPKRDLFALWGHVVLSSAFALFTPSADALVLDQPLLTFTLPQAATESMTIYLQCSWRIQTSRHIQLSMRRNYHRHTWMSTSMQELKQRFKWVNIDRHTVIISHTKTRIWTITPDTEVSRRAD